MLPVIFFGRLLSCGQSLVKLAAVCFDVIDAKKINTNVSAVARSKKKVLKTKK